MLEADPYFPTFHVRPAAGHVNDPNGPFYDPVGKMYHMFMQWRPYGATFGISWAHFASADLVTWTDLGVGLLADGKGGCPNTNGCFSGSTVVVNGMPTIVYPGVHHVDKSPTHPDGVGMAQCLARPANRSDPYLRDWTSQTIVPTDPMPADVNNHYHDDSQPWRSASDKRWWMFASGGSFNRSRGVNLLYSTSDADFMSTGSGWRFEHALWNITTGQCNFVSCPEMYPLPGRPQAQPLTSARVVYEALCGCDQYWLGSYDDDAHTFAPEAPYVPPAASKFCYDYGVGRASKSFWDERSNRRLMWSWITGDKHSPNATWDGSQSVPREVTLAAVADGGAQELAINPVAEVAALRRGPPLVDEAITLAQGTPPKAHAAGVALDVLANVSWEASAQAVSAGVRVLLGGGGAGDLIQFSAAHTSAQFMPSTNLPGGDVQGDDFSLNASARWTDQSGAAACASFCDERDECTGWTFVRPGSAGAAGEVTDAQVAKGGPRCAIKGAQQTAAPQADGCCVSGYKPGHAPAPVPNRTAVTISGGPHTMVGHFAQEEGDRRARLELRVLVDHSVVEVYDGTSALTFNTYPPQPELATAVQLEWVEGADVQASLRVYAMGGAVR